MTRCLCLFSGANGPSLKPKRTPSAVPAPDIRAFSLHHPHFPQYTLLDLCRVHGTI